MGNAGFVIASDSMWFPALSAIELCDIAIVLIEKLEGNNYHLLICMHMQDGVDTGC